MTVLDIIIGTMMYIGLSMFVISLVAIPIMIAGSKFYHKGRNDEN